MQFSENIGALILTNLGKISQSTNLMLSGYQSFCVVEENIWAIISLVMDTSATLFVLCC